MHEIADDGKAQARATELPGCGRLRLPEPFENCIQPVAFNADPGIRYLECQVYPVAVVATGRDAQMYFSVLREFEFHS